MVLHADKLGPAVHLGAKLHLGELPRPHRAGADIAHLAALDDVVQGFHCFFDGHSVIEAMDLEQVDVVCSKALERGVDLAENGMAGET